MRTLKKNWSIIRQYLGYQRFENPQITEKLNELYRSEWYDYFSTGSFRNSFIPFGGNKIKPSKLLSNFNPVQLQKEKVKKIKTIIKMATENSELLRNSEERSPEYEKENCPL